MSIWGFNRRETASSAASLTRQFPPSTASKNPTELSGRAWICKAPAGGLPAGQATAPGKALCQARYIDLADTLQDQSFQVTVYNIGPAIKGGTEFLAVQAGRALIAIVAGGFDCSQLCECDTYSKSRECGQTCGDMPCTWYSDSIGFWPPRGDQIGDYGLSVGGIFVQNGPSEFCNEDATLPATPADVDCQPDAQWSPGCWWRVPMKNISTESEDHFALVRVLWFGDPATDFSVQAYVSEAGGAAWDINGQAAGDAPLTHCDGTEQAIALTSGSGGFVYITAGPEQQSAQAQALAAALPDVSPASCTGCQSGDVAALLNRFAENRSIETLEAIKRRIGTAVSLDELRRTIERIL